jgi:hypothetical protein
MVNEPNPLRVMVVIVVATGLVRPDMFRRQQGVVERNPARAAKSGQLVVANIPGGMFADVGGVARRPRFR